MYIASNDIKKYMPHPGWKIYVFQNTLMTSYECGATFRTFPFKIHIFYPKHCLVVHRRQFSRFFLHLYGHDVYWNVCAAKHLTLVYVYGYFDHLYNYDLLSRFLCSVKRAELTFINWNGIDPDNDYYQRRQYINYQDNKIQIPLQLQSYISKLFLEWCFYKSN